MAWSSLLLEQIPSSQLFVELFSAASRRSQVRFLDVLLRYEADPNVKMMVLLGEVGGREEYLAARRHGKPSV